jgi:hypothetical protein
MIADDASWYIASCKKAHRLEIARIAGIENGHTVTEHVADIEVDMIWTLSGRPPMSL